MSDFLESFAGFVGGLLLIFVISMLLALPVMWLWNWLMPTLFGLTTVTWLEAWGLNLLCGFLFKPTIKNKAS